MVIVAALTPPPDPDPDDDLDGETFLPPLPPEDRLWRHPSEVAAARAADRVLHHGPSFTSLLVAAMIVVTLLGGLLALIATQGDGGAGVVGSDRPWMGIRVVTVDDDDRDRAAGIGVDHGLLVVAVTRKGPAAESGITVGDVITGIDTHRLTATAELLAWLNRHVPGDEVQIELWREDRSLTLWVELARHPD